MGKTIRLGLVLASAVAAIASATAPKPHEVQRTTVIHGNVDETWTAVIDVMTDHKWDVDKMDKASGYLATNWMDLGSKAEAYADCGSAPLASDGGTRIKLTVRVKPHGDGVSVAVDTTIQHGRGAMGETAIVNCESKGAAEALIADEVTRRVADAERASRAAGSAQGSGSASPE